MPRDIVRTLQHQARTVVDYLEARHQAVDPRQVAEQVIVAHAPLDLLTLPERAELREKIEQYVRELRAEDTHA